MQYRETLLCKSDLFLQHIQQYSNYPFVSTPILQTLDCRGNIHSTIANNL